MADKVRPIPEGYAGVTPYLVLKNAAAAIDFYTSALGAVETMRMSQPDGRVGHCDLRIGQAHIMLADEFPDMGALGPKSVGGSPVTLHVFVEDVDATYAEMQSVDALMHDADAPTKITKSRRYTKRRIIYLRKISFL